MAQITREVLDSTGMSLAIFCAGQSTVGIGITGSWVGTLSFYGSFDGVTFGSDRNAVCVRHDGDEHDGQR